MLRAVVFDFNGVLVDDEPVHLDLFRRVLAEEGVDLSGGAGDPLLSEAVYYERYVGFDDRDCLAAVLEAAGEAPDPGRLARLVARKAAYYQQRMRAGGYPFFPGAVELVKALAAAGVTLALVSGALRDEVEGALGQAGLRQCFKALVTADDVAAGKPDPEGYRQGLALVNARPPLPERLLHPHEVVAIEDTVAGLEAARAAGLVTLGVAHTYPRRVLEPVADDVTERIADVDAGRLAALL